MDTLDLMNAQIDAEDAGRDGKSASEAERIAGEYDGVTLRDIWPAYMRGFRAYMKERLAV